MKKIIRFISFTILLSLVLVSLEIFVFTGELKNSLYAQFFKEEEDSLDIVFIGNSTIKSGIIPVEIWNEHKITSFNITSSPTHPEVIALAIDEVMLHQNPKLIFIDITGIAIQKETDKDSYVKEFINSMPKSEHKDELKKKYSYIYEKHTLFSNHNDFRNPDYYDTNKGEVNKFLKGFVPKYHKVEREESTIVDDNKILELPEDGKYYLKKILDNCSKYPNVKFVFARMPRIITEESIKETYMLNSAIPIINEYGYEYINFEKYYKQIGLDSKNDFADVVHMNYRGALKFTKFIMTFLKFNYDISITNHRRSVEENFDNSYKSYVDNIKIKFVN